MVIIRSPRSQDDVIDIWNYLAAHNEDVADRFIDRVDAKLMLLEGHPFLGSARKAVRT